MLVATGIHSRRRAADELAVEDPDQQYRRWLDEQRAMEGMRGSNTTCVGTARRSQVRTSRVREGCQLRAARSLSHSMLQCCGLAMAYGKEPIAIARLPADDSIEVHSWHLRTVTSPKAKPFECSVLGEAWSARSQNEDTAF